MRRPNRCVEFAKPSRPCVSCLRACVNSFVSHVSIRVMTRVVVCTVHQVQRFASDTTSRNTGQAPQEINFVSCSITSIRPAHGPLLSTLKRSALRPKVQNREAKSTKRRLTTGRRRARSGSKQGGEEHEGSFIGALIIHVSLFCFEPRRPYYFPYLFFKLKNALKMKAHTNKMKTHMNRARGPPNAAYA
jgi:hypothetical protein